MEDHVGVDLVGDVALQVNYGELNKRWRASFNTYDLSVDSYYRH